MRIWNGQEAEAREARPSADEQRRSAGRCQRGAAATERGISQQKLAKTLGIGISFQQLQKYETGKNRITIGRLVAICEALEVSLADMVPGAS